ncbi:MAG: baseplate J/gp47 family protein, partial [Mycobacterium sp.]
RAWLAESVRGDGFTGAVKATGTVKVTWTAGATNAQGLQAGQILCATRWGVRYALTESLAVGGGAGAGTNTTVGVVAEYAGFEGNVEAEFIDQLALPSGVDPVSQIDWIPSTTTAGRDEFVASVAAGEITVIGVTAPSGGRLGTLDLIGKGRGKPRSDGEADADYRKRIRALPGGVTPNAILSAVNDYLRPYGVVATLWEPWDHWFVIGHPTRGVIGKSSNPISRLAHFKIKVPNLGTNVGGFVIGHPTRGVIGKSSNPIGKGDTVRDGVIEGLQQMVDSIKLGGVWAHVEEVA